MARFSSSADDRSRGEREGRRKVPRAVGVLLLRRFVDALRSARPARDRAHEPTSIAAGRSDPRVVEGVVARAVTAMEIPPLTIRTAGGRNARNQAELVHVIGRARAVTVPGPDASIGQTRTTQG